MNRRGFLSSAIALLTASTPAALLTTDRRYVEVFATISLGTGSLDPFEGYAVRLVNDDDITDDEIESFREEFERLKDAARAAVDRVGDWVVKLDTPGPMRILR